MEGRRIPKAPLATSFGCLLIVFLILFPKGGSRLGGVPLTWGYLLLMGVTPLAFAVRVLLMPLRFPRRILAVVFMLLPMQVLFVYAGHYYGIINPPYTFSTFVGLFALPWIFLLIFPPFFPLLDGQRLGNWFRHCVFLAAAWGVFLFFLHPLTGHFIEVPYLTVNASDYGELENTKNIARGPVFKLISTYNNGNLYGVATLLLLPLYLRMETSRLRRLTVRVALLLTLSRTVWAGLILNEVLALSLHLFRQINTFPVLYLKAARKQFLAVGVTFACIIGSLIFIGLRNAYLLHFLFDPTGGNRVAQFEVARDTSLLPESPLYGFGEVLYASAAQYWGWSGLVAFTLIMFSPLIVLLWYPHLLKSPLQRASLKGLMIYIVMAASDGALDFIPVMAFYWFVYAVYLCGWPGGYTLAIPGPYPAPEPDAVPLAGADPPLLEHPAGA